MQSEIGIFYGKLANWHQVHQEPQFPPSLKLVHQAAAKFIKVHPGTSRCYQVHQGVTRCINSHPRNSAASRVI